MVQGNILQSVILNQKRFCYVVLTGILGSNPVPANEASLEERLNRLAGDYVSKCRETNIIERIQLSRMTDRRKQKAIECSTEMWTSKALDLVNRHYKNTTETDKEFRSRTTDLIDLQLPWESTNNTSFLGKIDFATKTSTPDSEIEPSKVKVDTLKNYTTLNQ